MSLKRERERKGHTNTSRDREAVKQKDRWRN